MLPDLSALKLSHCLPKISHRQTQNPSTAPTALRPPQGAASFPPACLAHPPEPSPPLAFLSRYAHPLHCLPTLAHTDDTFSAACVSPPVLHCLTRANLTIYSSADILLPPLAVPASFLSLSDSLSFGRCPQAWLCVLTRVCVRAYVYIVFMCMSVYMCECECTCV